MKAGQIEEASVANVANESPTREFVGIKEGTFKHSEHYQDWTDIEKQMIMEALVKARGRKNIAAVSLGWSRSTLWRKMKKFGIHW